MNNQPKHSRGPWFLRAGDVVSESGAYIATALSVSLSRGTREANARLLAAAPELLEALSLALDALLLADAGDTALHDHISRVLEKAERGKAKPPTTVQAKRETPAELGKRLLGPKQSLPVLKDVYEKPTNPKRS